MNRNTPADRIGGEARLRREFEGVDGLAHQHVAWAKLAAPYRAVETEPALRPGPLVDVGGHDLMQ